MSIDTAMPAAELQSAGLDQRAVAEWIAAAPQRTGDYYVDRPRYSRYWQLGADLLGRLPNKPARGPGEARAAQSILAAAREQREHFLAAHAETLYDELTHQRSRFIRLEDLVFAAAMAVPGLTPTAAQVAAEAEHLQGEKDGVEIDQGIFLAHVLASDTAGRHLCHAMLLPRRGDGRAFAKIRRRRPHRFRQGFDRAPRQGGDRDLEERALSQCRGRHHA